MASKELGAIRLIFSFELDKQTFYVIFKRVEFAGSEYGYFLYYHVCKENDNISPCTYSMENVYP